MSEPFLGQVICVGFNFAPRGWALCDGQILPIAQNSALFSLLGTIYGGDGVSTFALPDLRSRIPIHKGQGPGLSSYSLGEKGGQETVVLTTAEMPSHQHQLRATTENPNSENPDGSALAKAGTDQFSDATNMVAMGSNTGYSGGTQAHWNMQPYLVIHYVIALQGVYPSRN